MYICANCKQKHCRQDRYCQDGKKSDFCDPRDHLYSDLAG
jgi:hypothetical protein